MSPIELATYADFAVRLVNSEEPARGTERLHTAEDARALFGGSRAAQRVVPADVPRLRSVRGRLRTVFESAASGEAEQSEQAVGVLNRLLIEYPVSPQISGHEQPDPRTPDGSPRWHLHLAEHAGSAAGLYAALAAMGLAVHLTDHGLNRLGVCGAPPCRNVYLDVSTNRSRRYCSERCATRANVAAYRARRRAGSNPPVARGMVDSQDGRGQ